MKKNATETKLTADTQGRNLPQTEQSGSVDPAVRDLPPANPLGEPVYPVDEYPDATDQMGRAQVLGEEPTGKAVAGETIVEHPLSPTDANPNPHGQRDSGVAPVDPGEDATVEVTGASDQPVHLGDGRTLAKGEKAKVTKEVAADLRKNKQVG